MALAALLRKPRDRTDLATFPRIFGKRIFGSYDFFSPDITQSIE
jgi:hypothetical protein